MLLSGFSSSLGLAVGQGSAHLQLAWEAFVKQLVTRWLYAQVPEARLKAYLLGKDKIKRGRRLELCYLVAFEGFPESDATWYTVKQIKCVMSTAPPPSAFPRKACCEPAACLQDRAAGCLLEPRD